MIGLAMLSPASRSMYGDVDMWAIPTRSDIDEFVRKHPAFAAKHPGVMAKLYQDAHAAVVALGGELV